MASAGPNAPGTAATDTAVGTVEISTPNDVKVSDNARATCTIINQGTKYTNYLKATNFGFTIPTGSTINGVTVSIEHYANNASAGFYTQDSVVSLVKGGTVSGNNKADTTTKWPAATDTTVTYGGVSDLWGLALSAEDINSSTFGMVLSAKLVTSGKGSAQASIDFISITVTYTEGGGGGASAVPTIMNSYRQRRA